MSNSLRSFSIILSLVLSVICSGYALGQLFPWSNPRCVAGTQEQTVRVQVIGISNQGNTRSVMLIRRQDNGTILTIPGLLRFSEADLKKLTVAN